MLTPAGSTLFWHTIQMSDTCVKYQLVTSHGTVIVCGKLDICNGKLVHEIEFRTLLCFYMHLDVCKKLEQIESNYVTINNRGLTLLAKAASTLAALV
jgi:hypothetical protein